MKTFTARLARHLRSTSWVRGLALSAAAIMLAACATTASTQRDSGSTAVAEASDDVLMVRAKQRWDLLIAGKTLEAWEYLSPGYRSTRDAARYAEDMRNRPARWLSAGVDRAECQEEDACVVVVKVQFEAPVPGQGGGAQAEGWVRENWLRLDGTWYHVP